MRYRDSGVDIDKANAANASISRSVRSTWSDAVLSDVGHFGGLFEIPEGYTQPVLVSSMDGVGTKLMVAQRARRYDTIGQDLVNHCVNDILVQGARPLFFLDYFATGKLEPATIAEVAEGLARACRANGCALIGGETAEMPGLYQGTDFDLAGTIVGVVDRDAVIDGTSVVAGDQVLALPSTGLHTNGYSLVRRVMFEKLGLSHDDSVEALGCTVADELLKVHASYLSEIDELRESVTVKALAHITGGGVVENLPRVLPKSCGARLDRGKWPTPPIFTFLQREGDITDAEMYRVFNMGLGMLAVVSADAAGKCPDRLGETPLYRVGEIVSGAHEVEVV